MNKSVPRIEFVPSKTIKIYLVREDELRLIKRGSPDSLRLQIGIAAISICIPTALSLLLLNFDNLSTLIAYWAFAVVLGVTGVIFLLYYLKFRAPVLVDEILARAPEIAPHGIQAQDAPDLNLPPVVTAVEFKALEEYSKPDDLAQ